MFDVIIVGGGIGGSAAALRAAQNNMTALWVLGDKQSRKRSRSQWVKNLDNIVGFHENVVKAQVVKTLLKYKQTQAAELIEKEHFHINNRAIIRNTIQRLKADFPNVTTVEGVAQQLVEENGSYQLIVGAESYSGAAVVLATGVMDEQPHVGGMNRQGEFQETPKWIYPFANREQFLYCIRCEGHLTQYDRVAVVGSKPMAAELGMMLYERYENEVVIVTNGVSPQFSSEQERFLKHYGIEVIREPVIGLMSEGVKQLQGFQFRRHEPVAVKFALVALGLHRVYNDLASQVGARLMDPEMPEEKRHVWINHKGETSVPNLFAVGDMVKREDEPVMKQVYTAQEYAVRAVDTIDFRRRKNRRNTLLNQS
ncbi:MAG: FAD-dependent oxidoreductase [Fidelibacterota bacterium]